MMAAEMKVNTPATLAKLAAMGYGYLEAFAAAIPSIPEFRKMLADAGLGCPSGHFTFGAGPTEKVLDDASALGVHYAISSVLLPPSNEPFDWPAMQKKLNSMERDDFKRMAEEANQIGEAARKRGIQFAYHNHNVEFRKLEGGETGYSIFLKGTDPELVKLEVDAGWMAAGGADPSAIIQANASRVNLLHFKDFASLIPPSNEMGGPMGQQIVDLGQGVAPLREAYRSARKAGVEYFIVDHDPPFRNQTAFDAARIDYEFVAGLLGG
jgi:sugar phosphate isomerase/epimerase